MEVTVQYLAERMRAFLKKGERVVICADHLPPAMGSLFEQAVADCEAVPVLWSGDRRWKTLLRLCFQNKVMTVIGPPMVILGLAKLARAKATPLYIRNVILAGDHCPDWMAEGIVNGLDCRVHDWGLCDSRSEPQVDDRLERTVCEIMEWTSVLDCRMSRGVGGLEIEIVVFPGEKLPKLPTCARLMLRHWNPERDEPLPVNQARNYDVFSGENH